MLRKTLGFTVIEVLVGISLFGVVIPVVIFAVIGLGDLNDRAADLTRANVLAEKKIEELRSLGYNAVDVVSDESFASELDNSLGQPRDATYTVTSPEAGVKEITITISYTDKDATRELTYRSIISELGVAQ